MRLEQLHTIAEDHEALRWAGRKALGAARAIAKVSGYVLRQAIEGALESGDIHVHSGGGSIFDLFGDGGDSMPGDVKRVLAALHKCVMAEVDGDSRAVTAEVIENCAEKLSDRIGSLPYDRQLSVLRDYRRYLAKKAG